MRNDPYTRKIVVDIGSILIAYSILIFTIWINHQIMVMYR